MNNCIPPQGTPPAVNDPCSMLPQLRAAYYTLLAGQATAQVRFGEQWKTYHRADARALEREVRRLEMICTADAFAPRAVRIGNYPASRHRRFRY